MNKRTAIYKSGTDVDKIECIILALILEVDVILFFLFFYLFTQDRTQMLEITHTYTPQTTA